MHGNAMLALLVILITFVHLDTVNAKVQIQEFNDSSTAKGKCARLTKRGANEEERGSFTNLFTFRSAGAKVATSTKVQSATNQMSFKGKAVVEGLGKSPSFRRAVENSPEMETVIKAGVKVTDEAQVLEIGKSIAMSGNVRSTSSKASRWFWIYVGIAALASVGLLGVAYSKRPG
ncbi:uncharacterized protein PHALS_06386 [Plasmopara halstedii]|uniref:RxLR-like protein n=1 Tax=Plasmopara halstedii TaxID=4781 RepID=A0A0P1B1K0_PLAHL|nr:uncharacterized protein PHALS_06386 [Plasmopara halstedii]CEG48570.1 hypothetical protein PHALS_06386 [Plasmopara halstedii]|eukprot:XP_024584939.1 hypothetical protein PHALS_06386 [Plasmopara halstedii]